MKLQSPTTKKSAALSLLLTFAALLVPSLQSAVVTNLMVDISGVAINRTVNFYPQSTPQSMTWGGTNVTVMDLAKSVASTNGAWAKQFVGGLYYADFGTMNDGTRTDRVLFLVPPNDSATYDFNYCANLATNLGTFVWTNNYYVQVTTNLAGNALVQVTNIAQSVSGSGGVTNGGGILAGMLTNASFSASGTNSVRYIAAPNTNSLTLFFTNESTQDYTDVVKYFSTITDNDSEYSYSFLAKKVTQANGGQSGASFLAEYNYTGLGGEFTYETLNGTGTGDAALGYSHNLSSTNISGSENRFAVGVGAFYGLSGQWGASYELLTKKRNTYWTTNQAGVFTHPFTIDGDGGTSLGDNPEVEHTKDWKSVPWVRIRGSSDSTRPQFQLEGSMRSFSGTITNGAFYNDGTSVHLAQRGAIAPIVTESSLGYSRFYFATNDLNVTNIVITNHVGYSITAPITNNGMYEIEVNAIARGNQATDRPYIITWITNNVAMGYVFTSRAFNGNGYAGWSSGFEQGAPTPGFILATNTSGLDTFLGNRPISENRPVSGTSQSSTANHVITLRLTNAPMNLFMSCSASATGTNTLKAGSYVKVTRIE